MLWASGIGTAAVTYKPAGLQLRRNPWAALLAVLLGILAGAASALGVSTTQSGSTSVSEQATDAGSRSKPLSVRFDVSDPSIGFGGDDDTSFALRNDEGALSHPFHLKPVHRQAFRLPVSIARVRNGLTRAPPLV
jgi:hypothetical protein